MSERLSHVEHALLAARHAGADVAEVMFVEREGTSARVRGDEIDFVTQARRRTLDIRAFVTGRTGLRGAITSTNDLAPEAVERMAREAVQLARETASDPVAGLPEAGFESAPPDLALAAPADREIGVETLVESARRAEHAARREDRRIVRSEGSEASASIRHLALGNSAGFRGEFASASHELTCAPIACEDGAMQVASWWTIARVRASLASPEEVGQRAAQRALRQLGARRVATCEVPVIFDPITAASLLRHVLACVSGYAVYREASFLAGRIGDRIASDLVSVVDDGRVPAGLGSRPFDGEGLPTRRTVLLDRGRLSSWLLDTYSARKLDLTSTGSAARGVGGAPCVSNTNLWLEPGRTTPEEIIAATPRGLLVTSLFGHGFSTVTGDFSRGAAGLWIESGRPVHAVEEVTVAGHLGTMLESVDAVGSDLAWLGSVAAPTLRIARMTVAGA